MNDSDLTLCLSAARLQTYVKDGTNGDALLRRYHYNIRLSEAFIPALHYLEITLRNRMNAAASGIYGDAWLISMSPELPISAIDKNRIDSYTTRFSQLKMRAPTQNDIVSHMSLGFWCGLFHKQFESALWQQKNVLKIAFPYLRRTQRTRTYIESRLQQVKALRNRIAHHEQILYMRTPAQDTHALCRDIIGYMSRDALTALKEIDRFPDVIEDVPNI